MSDAAPLRLFAAVDVPPKTRSAIESATGPWRQRLTGAKWVDPERWHVTVKFLGRTPVDLEGWVRSRCAEAASRIRPFRVSVGAPGVFPSPGRARVLWVGLRDREGGLPALAAALNLSLEREFLSEKRPFSPHLTIARFNPFADLRGVIEELRETPVDPAAFRISRIVLYRSHLSPKGARYEPLADFPLSG